MAKSRQSATTEKELQQLQVLLSAFPDGANFEALSTAFDGPISERTLLRRLTTLKDRGLVRLTGRTRSRIYHLIQASAPKSGETTPPAGAVHIPLSPESANIQRYLNQSESSRKPTGYDPSFLLSYRPNATYYLTGKERTHLLALGQTNQVNQPAGTYARQILQRLLIDLSWNSSRLEGNTYSLLDTKQLISQGQEAMDKSAADAQMILNHKDAIEFIVESAEEIGFNRYTIMNLHALLANNLLPDPGAPGRLRTFAVGIQKSVYIPLAIPQSLEEYFDVLLEKASAIEDPFEQAFFAMVQLPYLQPFDDVNKRVSRLAANIPLNKHNLAPLSFTDVPQPLYIQGLLGVYELRNAELMKDVFIWAYERSCALYAAIRQSLGEPDPFRVRHREDIREIVASVLTEAMSYDQARKKIHRYAMALPESERNKFIEVVETELLQLHEGNFARYKVRPSQFKNWQAVWNANSGNSRE
jgi:Fic family protein